jgi:hypothetical protein
MSQLLARLSNTTRTFKLHPQPLTLVRSFLVHGVCIIEPVPTERFAAGVLGVVQEI